MIRLLRHFLAVLVSATLHATPPDRHWTLVWNDEFDGTALDSSKWSSGSLPWGGIHHNDEYQSYITPEDSYVSGGSLWLRCRKIGRTVNGKWIPWTQGFAHTNGKFRATYGYAEIRAKFPQQKGTWPAFWTLSDGWPPEIDIAEPFGSDYRVHHGLATGPGWQDVRWDSTNTSAEGIWNWNTWGLEWGPGYLRFYKNGSVVHQVSGSHVPTQSMYFILNSGMRAGWDSSTQDPNSMQVDYLRIYSRGGELLNSWFGQGNAPWSRRGNAASTAGIGMWNGDGMRLTNGASGTQAAAEQTVRGLLPNHDYVLFGDGRMSVAGSGQVRIGVKNHGRPETFLPFTSTTYTRGVLPFTTGPANDSALIYGYLPSLNATGHLDNLQVRRAATVTNGDYERGAAWPSTDYGGVAITPWETRSGDFMLRFTNGSFPAGSEQEVYGLKPGTTYRLSGWAKSHGQSFRLGVKGHGASETSSGRTLWDWTWTRHLHEFTTGPAADRATVYVTMPSSANGNPLYFDDLWLTEPLVPGWTSSRVGTNGYSGEAGMINGNFAIRGSGNDIWNNADTFQFLHQPVTGDFTLETRLRSFDAIRPNAKAGLMMRASLDAGAPHVLVCWNPRQLVERIQRATTGANTTSTLSTAVPTTPWLRLKRAGSVFTAYYSINGSTWTDLGSSTLDLPVSVSAGLVVNAHASTEVAEAIFEGAHVTRVDSNLNGIPDDWEREHFGGSLVEDVTLDHDGDGQSTEMEWLAGTDPRDAASRFKLHVLAASPGGVHFTWPAIPGRRYTVESSQDLAAQTWQEVASQVSVDGGPSTLHFQQVPPAGARRFYRLRIEAVTAP
jgi:beta-glucanase (GH16 family)